MIFKTTAKRRNECRMTKSKSATCIVISHEYTDVQSRQTGQDLSSSKGTVVNCFKGGRSILYSVCVKPSTNARTSPSMTATYSRLTMGKAEVVVRPPPRKPRRRKYETEEQWNQRNLEWAASKHHASEVKPKGNSMTQKYYAQRLLPVYCTAIQLALFETTEWPRKMYLQEDNNGSHGHKVVGLADQYRRQAAITLFPHPPNSPDLNPIEAC